MMKWPFDRLFGVRVFVGGPRFGLVVALVLAGVLQLVGCAPLSDGGMPTDSSWPRASATEAPGEETVVVVNGDEVRSSSESGGAVAQGPLILRMEPSVIDLAVGESRRVQVFIDNANRLHGIELLIKFDPAYVQVDDVDLEEAGVQIETGVIPIPSWVIWREADNQAGLIIYNVTQTSEQPMSGGGVVMAFTLRAIAEGGSPLRFSAVDLRDPAGDPLSSPEWVDGLAVINADGAVPEPTAMAVSEGAYYVIQPGDTLHDIARRHSMTVQELAALNGLVEPYVIYAGQILVLKSISP